MAKLVLVDNNARVASSAKTGSIYSVFAYLTKKSDYSTFRGEHGTGRLAFFKADPDSKQQYLLQIAKKHQPRQAAFEAAPWEHFLTVRERAGLVLAYDARRGIAALFRKRPLLTNVAIQASDRVIRAAKSDADQLSEDIIATFKKVFPKSPVSARFNPNIAPNIHVMFALGTKDTWANGIIHNDPMHMTWHVGMAKVGPGQTEFDENGMFRTGKITIKMSIGGTLDLGTYNKTTYRYESIKIPYRKQTVDASKVTEHFKRYLKKMRDVYEKNKHLLSETRRVDA